MATSLASIVFGKSGESGFLQLGSPGWTVAIHETGGLLLLIHRGEEFGKSLGQ
jgi:hypothetical protein